MQKSALKKLYSFERGQHRSPFLAHPVFKCWPNDNVTSWEALERYKLAYKESSLAIADPREAELLLAGLKGYLVDFPTKFLQSADLAPPVIPDSMQFPFTWESPSPTDVINKSKMWDVQKSARLRYSSIISCLHFLQYYLDLESRQVLPNQHFFEFFTIQQ
uniref:Uncharacterized protein n=1 Tax=Romanomermis culicivorax TaxID=13658 RepID=A0A915KRM8_ROMCU